MAIFTDKAAIGQELIRCVNLFAPDYGLDVVAEVDYSSNATDLSSQVLALKQADPDAILCDSYIGDATLFVQTLKEQNYKPKMIVAKANGFTDDQFGAPSFANGYPEGGKSTYSESQTRAASFYLNGGYSYDNRYLLDFNYRSDGASMFGTNNRFRNTWSVGVGWNIQNERFLRDSKFFQLLKLRASVGNPGNQNFAAYQAFSTYAFNGWMTNIFGTGVILNQLGNPDLAWQETVNYNVGTDVTVWGNRVNVTFDYYVKITDPLLAIITTPGSMGITSVTMNAGQQKTNGVELTLKVSPVYRPHDRINWNISLNGTHAKAKYAKIGNAFSSLNNEGRASLSGMTRYYDGGSPTAIWGMRSAGIDPATGKELFIKKDGTYSFSYDVNDEVVLGDTEPKLEGVIGGTEETTTGVVRLMAMAKDGALRYPVFNINDANTKHCFDNHYGTGQSTLDGIVRATNRLLCGRTMVVSGYGYCGSGLAQRAKGMGMDVIVCEVDPLKALEAHMEGYRVMKAEDAARFADVWVTVTGDCNVIDEPAFKNMKDGAIICNSGHFDSEINMKWLRANAVKVEELKPLVEEYTLPDGRTITVLAEGRLVNLACAEGHPASVMDMSFANQALAAEYLFKHASELEDKVYDVPAAIDDDVARVKLETLGIEIDTLTEEQIAYMNSWNF